MDELRRVLVVDQSKVARSALAKHLREHFDVREEADGESAWQTLVLDSSIVAIVCAAQLPRLSGLDLLARIRISKLRRICDIPFLLLVSGNESVDDRLRAQETGVTDFITRGMSRDEVLACINRLVNWEFATNLSNSQILPATIRHDRRLTPPEEKTHWEPLDEATLHAHLEASMLHLEARQGMVGVIAFGLDDAAHLSGLYGQKTLLTISKRLGKILHAKIGKDDRVGCDRHGRCVIITPGSSTASCLAFAQRVCRGLAQSHVAIGGSPLNFKVSAGIAGLPADGPRDATQLLELAYDRLQRAQSGGGNCVVADETSAQDFSLTPDFLIKLERFCASGSSLAVGSLGKELMPLLRLLDREFDFRLPLETIEQRFEDRAKSEKVD
jgi:two-component system, cell cycle response regulator